MIILHDITDYDDVDYCNDYNNGILNLIRSCMPYLCGSVGGVPGLGHGVAALVVLGGAGDKGSSHGGVGYLEVVPLRDGLLLGGELCRVVPGREERLVVVGVRWQGRVGDHWDACLLGHNGAVQLSHDLPTFLFYVLKAVVGFAITALPGLLPLQHEVAVSAHVLCPLVALEWRWRGFFADWLQALRVRAEGPLTGHPLERATVFTLG